MTAHLRSQPGFDSCRSLLSAIAAAICLATASAADGQCPVSFDTPVHYGSGETPYSVAIGDLNGDGKLDLVTPNSCCANVFVLLGNGDGTFQKGLESGAGDTPAFVAVGDLNGDSVPDLAVANIYSNTVSVLLGNGDGSFRTKVDYDVREFPVSLAIGDLNGDGEPDLAVANAGSARVSVLLGRGNGTFTSRSDYWVDDSPMSVAIGDLNGDAKLDLAVANSGSANVSVLFGTGDGSFQTQVKYGAASSPSGVAIGDLDGDGQADLAIASADSAKISVRLGNAGVFASKTDFDVPGTPVGLAIEDLDGDGVFDLAVANSGIASVAIMQGRGDGTFQAPAILPAADAAAVATGDLNGDGKPDLAVAGYSNGSIAVYLNKAESPIAVCRDITLSADDSCQASVTWEMVGIGSTAGENCPPATISLIPPGPYALGDTAVTLTVTGSFGLTDTCNAIVTVVDTTPPELTIPADVECSDSTDVSAIGTATATDRCDAAPLVAYLDVVDAPASGMITRRWTATDASGNRVSLDQIIARIDMTPPVITCAGDIVLSNGPEAVTFAVEATDNCDPNPSVTIDRESGSIFDEGITEVLVTARDASGNTSTCSFRVTVSPPEGEALRDTAREYGDALRSSAQQFLGPAASLCGLGLSLSLVGTTAGLCGMKLGMRRRSR